MVAEAPVPTMVSLYTVVLTRSLIAKGMVVVALTRTLSTRSTGPIAAVLAGLGLEESVPTMVCNPTAAVPMFLKAFTLTVAHLIHLNGRGMAEVAHSSTLTTRSTEAAGAAVGVASE